MHHRFLAFSFEDSLVSDRVLDCFVALLNAKPKFVIFGSQLLAPVEQQECMFKLATVEQRLGFDQDSFHIILVGFQYLNKTYEGRGQYILHSVYFRRGLGLPTRPTPLRETSFQPSCESGRLHAWLSVKTTIIVHFWSPLT